MNIALVLNTFEFDNRVEKTVESLARKTGSCVLFAMGKKDLASELELAHGAKVIRLDVNFPKWVPTLLRHGLQYLAFSFKVLKQLRGKTVENIHANDMLTLPLAILLKKLKGKTAYLVYDAHELETERASNINYPKKTLKHIEKWLIKYCDSMITVSPMIAEHYAMEYGISQPFVVLNCPKFQKTDANGIFQKRFNIPESDTIFLYQGGLFANRGVEQIIEVAKQAPSNKHFVFMGYGPLEDLIKAAEAKHHNIHFHEAVSGDVLLNYTANADYGFYFVRNSNLSYAYSLGNKLFEYNMAGLNVLAHELPQVQSFLKENNIGSTMDCDNIDEVLKLVSTLDKPEKSDRSALARKYCWESQEEMLFAAHQLK